MQYPDPYADSQLSHDGKGLRLTEQRTTFGGTLAERPLLAGTLIATLMAIGAFSGGAMGAGLACFVTIGAILLPQAGLVALALTLFTLPLVRLFPPIADIRPDEVLMVALVAGMAMRWWIRKDAPRTGLVLSFAIFAGSAAIWVFGRGLIMPAVPAKEYLFPIAKHVLRFVVFLAVVWSVRADRGFASKLRVAFVAGGILGGLIGLGQAFVPAIESWVLVTYPSIRGGMTREFFFNRAFGAFDGNPNHLGVGMMLAAFVALAASESAADKRLKWAWLAAALIPIFALVATGSRADYVLFLVMLFVMAWRKRRAFLWGALAQLAYTVAAPNALRDRILKIAQVTDKGVELGTSAAEKVAMAGGGTLRGRLVSTDNFYLDTLYNFSVVSLLAFLVLLYELGRPLYWALKNREEVQGYALAGMLALVSFALLSLQGPYFAGARVVEMFWIIMGLAWGMLPNAYADGVRTHWKQWRGRTAKPGTAESA